MEKRRPGPAPPFPHGGPGFGITAFCFFYVLLHLPASLTEMIFFSSYPTLATLLSAWLPWEALHLRKLAALLLVISGGIVMVWS